MLTLKRINNITNAILSKTNTFAALGHIVITSKGLFRYDEYKDEYVDRNPFYFSSCKFIDIDYGNYDAQSIIDASREVFSTQDRYLYTIINKNYYWLHNLGQRWEIEAKNKEIPEFIKQDIEIIYEEKDGLVTKYYSIPFMQKSIRYEVYNDGFEEIEIETDEEVEVIAYRFNSTSLDFKNDDLFIDCVLVFARAFCNYPLTRNELLEDFDNIINNFKIQMY
jgi:hypothetical protein